NFVENLERLARLDRLGTGGVNCFDAVEGVGGALRRVWEMETTKKRQATREERQEDIEMAVLCKGSGKPTMHASGRLGQALQYWQESRHISGRKRSADDMDIDSPPAKEAISSKEPTRWSATIECEPCSSDLYPPIRVSSDWVTNDPCTDQQQEQHQQDPFTSITPSESSPFTWHDPPPTFITSDPSAMDLSLSQSNNNNNNKTPDFRFTARLHPPLLVPLQTALNIYASVGAPLAQDSIQPTTFDSLLFPATTPPTNERIAERELYTPGGTKKKKHKYTLFTDPQAYARTIAEIPFAHPRQIVQLLPVLRQWAFISSLLRRCFFPSPSSSSSSSSSSSLTRTNINGAAKDDTDDENEEDDNNNNDNNSPPSPSSQLENLLNPSPLASSKSKAKPKNIDISLAFSGAAPRFRLSFERQGEVADVGFCVGLNAEVGDVDVFVLEGEGSGADNNEGAGSSSSSREGKDKAGKRREKVKKVIEVGEDLGVLVEWIVGVEG
ncbi:MAG: hypothetical protein L6R35_007212, partial [Caloplaca aegaea]